MRCITFDTNIRTPARTSQYKLFNYGSMMTCHDKLLGVNSTGLYLLEGDRDEREGTQYPIDAWMTTGMTDLGIETNKRFRHIYLGIETDKDILVEFYADEKLVKTVTCKPRKKGQQRIRASVGRYKGVFWHFKIKNRLGAWFGIDILQVVPITLHHGNI